VPAESPQVHFDIGYFLFGVRYSLRCVACEVGPPIEALVLVLSDGAGGGGTVLVIVLDAYGVLLDKPTSRSPGEGQVRQSSTRTSRSTGSVICLVRSIHESATKTRRHEEKTGNGSDLSLRKNGTTGFSSDHVAIPLFSKTS